MKKINVISIGEIDKSNFMSRIYTNDEFNYKNYTLGSLDYNTIDKQDAIVLNELIEIPQALQTTLKSFVNKGGNLIVIPTENTSIPYFNIFLNNFGNAQFKTFETNEKLITKINFNHPLFAGVFENRINNFQYPKTKKAFAFSSSSSAILSYEDQSPFLIALKKSVSSVYVFSAPINILNSNFQQSWSRLG